MEWTKVKPKHYLFADLTLANKGALITLVCLTAQLERIPNSSEINKLMRQSCYDCLAKVMQKLGTSVVEVLQKVIQDVDKIEQKKEVSRKTSKTYREVSKKRDTSHDTTDKIREDKIREEYIKIGNHVHIKISSLKDLKELYGASIIIEYMKKINDYLSATGKKGYKDYAAALRNWLRKDNIKPKPEVFTAGEKVTKNEPIFQGSKIKDLTKNIGG